MLRPAILLTWVGLLAVLGYRTWSASAVRTEPPVVSDTPAGASEEWMGVYQGSHKIGYTQQSVVPDGDGYRFAQMSVLRLAVLGAPQTVHTLAQGTTDHHWALRDMTFELTSGPSTLHVAAQVDGSVLAVTIRTGGETTTQRVPLSDPVYVPAMVRTLVGSEPLVAGRVLEASVFDPTVMRNEPIRLVVDREEEVPGTDGARRAWRVREGFRGMETVVWLDGQGAVWREEGPMGLVLIREDPARALHAGWEDGTILDLVNAMAVPVGDIENPRTRPSLRLQLSGIRADRVPSDAVQRWDGTTITITPPALGRVGTYPLPYRGDELRAELAPDPLLQSEHPRVRAAAVAAIGDTTDAKVAVQRLTDWVYRTLRKTPTVSIPNALQVLDMGAGDCNEHAVLLAALGRAVGVPTRLVAGVVYVDGAFLYHAWCEVWLGEWVAVDPAFGQVPADATHIKFVAGGPEEQFAMVEVIGRLRITPVEAGGPPPG